MRRPILAAVALLFSVSLAWAEDAPKLPDGQLKKMPPIKKLSEVNQEESMKPTAPEAATDATKEVRLLADPWCPHNCEDQAKPGYMVEIAKKAFEKHGYKVTYEIVPWARAVEEVKQGKADAIVGAAKGDAPDFVFPSLEQGHSQNAYYTLPESKWEFKGHGSLEAVRLGSIAGYSYGDAADAYIEKNKGDMRRVQQVGGDKPLTLNLRKLRAGRIDTLIEEVSVMNYHLASEPGSPQVRVAGYDKEPAKDGSIYEDDKLYLAFSPAKMTSKTLAEMLAAETKTMRESGELEQVLNTYNVKDWRNKTQ